MNKKTLILTNSQIKSLISIKDVLKVTEDAFRKAGVRFK